MDCVNHNGVTAAAYCQNCGKALCQACVRKGPSGQIFCEPCWKVWSAAANPQGGYVPPPMGGPSPGLAAVLGAIPGVGAMYNGQFVKGLIHVAIFAVLVSMAHIYDVFGLFIMAWIFYQMFDAYHTAKARRDGDPLPDPLGLNELSQAIMSGGRATPPGANQNPYPGANPGAAGQAPSQATYQVPPQGVPYQNPYQAPYGGSYPPPPGAAGLGFPPIPPIPPVPPIYPPYWQRRAPVGAVILIALGVMFLLGQFSWFSWDIFKYFWPLLLIGLGVWMIVHRMQEAQIPQPGRPPADSQGDEK
jgi:hypothetical protein